jgi:hypothetical protein
MTIPINRPRGDPGARRWGEFELLDEIGRGAFGAVYRSHHPTLQQEVALKLLAVSSDDVRAINKALEEARRLASIRHQHVVVVHDARYLDGYVGICMELVRGQSLEAIVSDRGPFDSIEAGNCIRVLAGALSAVHRARIVHNDIKAKNVLRETGGRVVLMDFGAGRRVQDSNASTGLTVVGTPLYMAPEIFKLREPTNVSDIYSLGVLWFYLLTGAYPVEGETIHSLADAHASGRRRFLGDFRDDVPDQVHYVINRALEPDPANRYQSCGALLDDLNASSPVFVPRPTRSSAPAVSEVRDRFNIRRRTWFAGDVMIWGAAIIAAVLVGVGAIGFMASKAYGVMFGFQGEFAVESPGVWLEVGARTLPLVVVMVVVIEVVWAAAALIWRVTSRNSTLVGTWSQRTTQSLLAASERTGLDDARSGATMLLIVHGAVLLAAGWWFKDLIGAFTTPIVDVVLPTHILLSQRPLWLLFREVMSLLTVAGGYGWWLALRHWRLAEVGVARAIAGIALTVASLALATVPWRIVLQSTFENATYGSEPCFIVAERETRVQLYCPGRQETTRIVETSDKRLVRLGTKQNVFSAVANGRPAGGS